MAAKKQVIKQEQQQQTSTTSNAGQQQNSNHDIFATMHQCSYCSESFFSGYSLISHMRIHNKGGGKAGILDNTGAGGSAFPGFPPPSSSSSSSTSNVQNNQVMDYSWHQGSW